MDSLTQIVLGAAVGEAVGGRKMGIKAAFWGGVAGTIPDLDVFLNYFFNPIEASLVHRGFSHSILFACLFSPIFAWIVHFIYKKKYAYKTWLLLFFFGIITHPLLDIFTNYGTSLLWPLDNRLAISSVFVIDPLYTVPFMATVIIAICLKRDAKWRSIINWSGIIYSSAYLLWGVLVQATIRQHSDDYFAQSNVKVDRTYIAAMPLTTFYWMILGENKDAYYLTYKSIFAHYNSDDLIRIEKNHQLLQELTWKNEEKNSVELLNRFSKGYYTVEQKDSLVVFYDLRFGTAAKLTNNQLKDPIFGFGMIIDNTFVNKIERYRNQSMFSKVNFGTYLKNAIGKHEETN
jgi:inner membrane protein